MTFDFEYYKIRTIVLEIVNVVLNRVEDERFDDNINDVIFSPGQFSPAGKSYFKNIEPTEEDIKAVKEALNGTDYSEGALYFKKAKDESDWGSLECLFKHEDHGFYK